MPPDDVAAILAMEGVLMVDVKNATASQTKVDEK